MVMPARGTPEKTRSIIGEALDSVRNQMKKAASKVLEVVRARLHEPAVREANTAAVRTTAKESLLKKLKENQDRLRTENAGSKPADRKRKQDIRMGHFVHSGESGSSCQNDYLIPIDFVRS